MEKYSLEFLIVLYQIELKSKISIYFQKLNGNLKNKESKKNWGKYYMILICMKKISNK